MRNSKLNKALGVIDEHIEQLKSVDSLQSCELWKSAVRESLALFLKEDSSLLSRLNELKMSKNAVSKIPGIAMSFPEFDPSKKDHFVKFLETVKAHIETHGLHKKTNNLNHGLILRNSIFWAIIIFVLPSTFYAGYYFGENKRDREYLKMEQEFSKIMENNYVKESSSHSPKMEVNNVRPIDTLITTTTKEEPDEN